MYDPTVQLGKVATIACWVVAGGLLATAWIVGMFGDWEVAVMLGFTSTIFLAAATVLSVRGYASRIINLMRACDRGEVRAPEPELRSVP